MTDPPALALIAAAAARRTGAGACQWLQDISPGDHPRAVTQPASGPPLQALDSPAQRRLATGGGVRGNQRRHGRAGG